MTFHDAFLLTLSICAAVVALCAVLYVLAAIADYHPIIGGVLIVGLFVGGFTLLFMLAPT